MTAASMILIAVLLTIPWMWTQFSSMIHRHEMKKEEREERKAREKESEKERENEREKGRQERKKERKKDIMLWKKEE